jgi:hypothetical protein
VDPDQVYQVPAGLKIRAAVIYRRIHPGNHDQLLFHGSFSFVVS